MSDLPADLVASESDEPIIGESDQEVLELPTLESQDPVFDTLEDPIAFQANEDEIGKEMAWLDTLGAVRAEEWLAAEEEVPDHTPESDQAVSESVEEVATDFESVMMEKETVEEEISAEITPDLAPEEILREGEQAELEIARSALDAGQVTEALEKYESLLDNDSSIPFVISDLEASLDRESDQLLVQRTLGDAYVRNGQLKKALELYRQALDTL